MLKLVLKRKKIKRIRGAKMYPKDFSSVVFDCRRRHTGAQFTHQFLVAVAEIETNDQQVL